MMLPKIKFHGPIMNLKPLNVTVSSLLTVNKEHNILEMFRIIYNSPQSKLYRHTGLIKQMCVTDDVQR